MISVTILASPVRLSVAGESHVGLGRAYAVLADLPVKHQDRVKPLGSMAIEVIRRVHGRATVKLPGADGKSTQIWEPVAAILDWSARPEFWDDQAFVLVEDRSLRTMLRDASIRTQPRALAAGEVAARLVEDSPWFSPRELETTLLEIAGQTLTFPQWVGEILARKERNASDSGGSRTIPTPNEEKAIEVGERLRIYEAIRQHRTSDLVPLDLLLVPRPTDETYQKYSTEVFEKGMKPDQSLTPLEANVANSLVEYLQTLPNKKWALPGEDAVFDQEYSTWLFARSRWIPVGVILASDESETSRAGLPLKQIQAFRTTFRDLEAAERSAPGEIPEATVVAFLNAARDLGASLINYPTSSVMARESRYNRLAPFSKAVIANGSCFVLLLLSLAITADRRSVLGRVRLAMYCLGLVALLAGIALESYGFFLRFRIFVMIPTTNPYETIVCVALLTSSLGLLYELLWRKKYAALVASGIALVATFLAENLAGIDPNFRVVVPLEKINKWMASHVVTTLSSYAAFALAMGLGLLSLGYYLTATYRRTASYRELGWPMFVGFPLSLLGRFGMEDPSGIVSKAPWLDHAIPAIAAVGGVLTLVGGLSVLGEFANRFPRRACVLGIALAAVGAIGWVVPGPWARVLTAYDACLVLAVGSASILLGFLGIQGTEPLSRIESLARFSSWTIRLGLLLLVVGVAAGGLWARSVWQESWIRDPKVIWTLITFLVYLVPLIGRWTGWMTTFGVVTASVTCFMVVLISWCGVNLMTGGSRHDFGFAPAEIRNFVRIAALALLAVAGAAGWRRSRSQAVASLGD